MVKTFIAYAVCALVCEFMLFLIPNVFEKYFSNLHGEHTIRKITAVTYLIFSVSLFYYVFCMLVILLKKIIDKIYGLIADD